MLFRTANVSQLGQFDEIIDVRTPTEFSEDHIPGAINCPVLSNEERIRVGTIYKEVSPFEARKIGAALVAKNIAEHLQQRFHEHPKSWRPLVYCWRGGQRSGAMSIILSQAGWMVHKLDGGYKAYRRHVLEKLEALPQNFSFRVICGLTGSGKSRLLQALEHIGQQVLDLEGIAKHRGSVLGMQPEQPQPTQKSFDSEVLQVLQNFDPIKPVYIEAESHKIGLVTVPPAIIAAMHASPCIFLDTPFELRVAGLMEEYHYYVENPEIFIAHLNSLRHFHSVQRMMNWNKLIREGNFRKMVGELLTNHYDLMYHRATTKHFMQLDNAEHIPIDNLSQSALEEIAKQF